MSRSGPVDHAGPAGGAAAGAAGGAIRPGLHVVKSRKSMAFHFRGGMSALNQALDNAGETAVAILSDGMDGMTQLTVQSRLGAVFLWSRYNKGDIAIMYPDGHYESLLITYDKRVESGYDYLTVLELLAIASGAQLDIAWVSALMPFWTGRRTVVHRQSVAESDLCLRMDSMDMRMDSMDISKEGGGKK